MPTLYIKLNKNKLIESCQSPLEGADQIEVTQEELEKINLQFDTVIENGVVTSQVKGENALALEASIANSSSEIINE